MIYKRQATQIINPITSSILTNFRNAFTGKLTNIKQPIWSLTISPLLKWFPTPLLIFKVQY